MTEAEKEEFKSVLEKYGQPIIIVVDIVFLAVTIYGSIMGFSSTVMAILTAFSFVGFHATYRALMGLLVGAFRPMLKLNSWIYIVDPIEVSIYESLGVKSWKDKVPAWNKTHFMLSMKDIRDINKVAWVLRYNISAEITHHINFCLSILGTLFCLLKGMQQWWWIFGSVSLLLGIVGDIPFAIIQRYNRSRVLPIYLRLEEKALKQEIKAREEENTQNI